MSADKDALHFRDIVITESSDFSQSNDDGSVTVPANEEMGLVEYEPPSGDNRVLIHGFGATDALDVRYRLRYGGEEISFTTETALGGVTDPFIFREVFGSPATAGSGTVQLTALNDGDQPVDLVARMFVEVV